MVKTKTKTTSTVTVKEIVDALGLKGKLVGFGANNHKKANKIENREIIITTEQ